ncbi:hypothetical protein Hanom_Chr02g00114941 [Helianthus anomalus]
MPSSYPGRHMPFPILEPSTSEKRWVSVANWATPVGYITSYVVKGDRRTQGTKVSSGPRRKVPHKALAREKKSSRRKKQKITTCTA